MHKKFVQLEQCLDYQFEDKNLIIEALTHKSFKKTYNNERLEFLGDAVLNLIVGEYLYHKFPASNEGDLSKTRASLVNEQGFTKLALAINLGDYIYLSDAEDRNEGRQKASILSDTFEAIIGALYQDQGFNKTNEFIKKYLLSLVEKMPKNKLPQDYKSKFQEKIQAQGKPTPIYKIIKTKGPDNHKLFKAVALVANKVYGKGVGKSKQFAEQMAAKDALKRKEEKC